MRMWLYYCQEGMGGFNTGDRCAVCGERIAWGDPYYVIYFNARYAMESGPDALLVHDHSECQQTWREIPFVERVGEAAP